MTRIKHALPDLKEARNRRKEETKQPVKHPTKEMTKAIEAALVHFNIIKEN